MGFCISAFVFCPTDPQAEVEAILAAHGMVLGHDEFKSSTWAQTNSRNAALRDELKDLLLKSGKIGIAISKSPREIPEDAGDLLVKMLRHLRVGNGPHSVFIDEGIFARAADRTHLQSILNDSKCTIHAEQDSKAIAGIQLADLAAHTCSIMMKDALGLVTKKVRVGENSGYDPNMDTELGFMMFASIRYCFLGKARPYDDSVPQSQWAYTDLTDYGLVVGKYLEESVSAAALSRFASIYIGCIH